MTFFEGRAVSPGLRAGGDAGPSTGPQAANATAPGGVAT